MIVVTLKQLREALRAGRRIDGSGLVLAGPSGRARTRRLVLNGGIIPPFEQAAFQTDAPGDRPPELTLSDFELLSLASRTYMAQTDCPGIALAAHDESGLRERFPVVYAEDLIKAINEAIGYLQLTGPFGDARPDRPAAARNATSAQIKGEFRAGLQIVGCRITSRLRKRGRPTSMRLANFNMPFSLRLIGCAVETPIVANHCELQSLDLSGSAVAGLDAAFLQARGSVRLRRTTILSPANFGGARITGVFDATDSVMQPRHEPPRGEAFAAERGMLNLGQAHFANDVYLNRARIWGGLILRGAVMERSLFLNRTLVRSPVGVLERLGCEAMQRLIDVWKTQPADPDRPDPYRPSSEIDALLTDNKLLVKELHDYPPPDRPDGQRSPEQLIEIARIDAMRAAETIGKRDFTVFPEALSQLLSESMRARTSAIRADGLVVHGSIFARRLKTMGRIRLNYARIGAGLHLEGSRLRSVAAIGRILDTFCWIARTEQKTEADLPSVADYHQKRQATRKLARKIEHQKDDDFALDLQEATFGGSIILSSLQRDIGGDGRGGSSDAKPVGDTVEEPAHRATEIDGVIAADRVRIRGDLVMAGMNFGFPPKRSYDDVKREKMEDTPRHRRIALDWNLRRIYEGRRSWRDPDLGSRAPTSMRLTNSVVEGDIDLRESRGMFGLDLENAEVAGSLVFADKISAPHGSLKLPRRAMEVTGELVLRNAKIGGDAFLVFSATTGPSIKAEFAEVGGRLDIYPQVAGEVAEDARPPMDVAIPFSDFVRTALRARRARWDLRSSLHQRGGPNLPPGRRAKIIDLRNAGAAVFCHPPPAWPDQDCLSLEGFSYERSHPDGPLVPHPFPTDRRAAAPLAFPLWRQAREMWPLVWGVWCVVAKLYWRPLLAWLVVLFAIALFGAERGWWTQYWLARLIWREGGATNQAILLGLAAAVAVLEVIRMRSPTSGRSRPMALEYLKLQRNEANRYRVDGSTYWSVDPYVRAAKALREEGRAISANLVEAERLRHRTSMLSWRHHLLPKIGMLLVEKLAHYGFDVARAVALLAFFTIIAGMTANTALHCGALAYEPHANPSVTASTRAGTTVIAIPTAEPVPPPFEALWYGASVVIPFFELEENKGWRPIAPSRPNPAPGCAAWRPDGLSGSWKPIFTIIGLILSTIAAVAIGTRVEGAFRRVEE